MKIVILIIRVLTGLLFIFSGLIKAIDPRGLAYKMQEFFEAWANDGVSKSLMSVLNEQALAFSIIMITLEVLVGVALVIGWQKKITAWLVFLLMLFFTFLTSYVLFTGKIRACGCFGDCVPLTPVQTFTKDIILVIFSLILLLSLKKITPLFSRVVGNLIMLAAFILAIGLQWYVLRHLPVIDCLPFKKGNNIVELMKMPADAVQDKYEYLFTYEKNGEVKDFTTDALPDSTWEFKERKQTLVEKGRNNIPAINDFSFTNAEGNSVTDSILSIENNYFIYFIRTLPKGDFWVENYRKFYSKASAAGKPVFVSTAEADKVRNFFAEQKLPVQAILSTDATAIKTAARTNPAALEMKGPVIVNKKSWADVQQF